MRMSRRQFVAAAGGSLLLGGGYSFGWEPEWLEYNKKMCPKPLPTTSPTRIIHISDLHYSSPAHLPYLELTFDLIVQMSPDAVCITGDFISSGIKVEFEPYINLLRKLALEVPTIACLGNHDGGPWAAKRNGYRTSEFMQTILKGCGIEVLHNRNTTIGSNVSGFNVVGLGDLWSEEFLPKAAFQGSRRKLPTIVMSHNPDSKNLLQNYDWTLMLSGHTHGGQISIPYFGPLWVPIQDRAFTAGMLPWEGRYIHVSRGIGNLHGVRFNCRPEATMITFGTAESA